MSDHRRAPSEFLPEARHVVVQLERQQIPDRENVAYLDQVRAATNHAGEIVSLASRMTGLPLTTAPLSVHNVAWMLAVKAACDRVMKVVCPHTRQMPQIIFASATFGVMACSPCLGRFMASDPEMICDDRCDVCDRKVKVFTEVTTRLGSTIVYVNACKRCARYSQTVLADVERVSG